MKEKSNAGQIDGERDEEEKKKIPSVVVSGSGMFGKNEGLSHFVFLPVASESH